VLVVEDHYPAGGIGEAAAAALPSFGLRATGTDGDAAGGDSDLAICLPKMDGKPRTSANAGGFSGAQKEDEAELVECCEMAV